MRSTDPDFSTSRCWRRNQRAQKSTQHYWWTNFLHIWMASFVFFLLLTTVNSSNDVYFKRRDIRLTENDIVYSGKQIKEFTKENVVRCFDNLDTKNRRRTHVAFVGDSLVRQVFLAFLKVKNVQLFHFFLVNTIKCEAIDDLRLDRCR